MKGTNDREERRFNLKNFGVEDSLGEKKARQMETSDGSGKMVYSDKYFDYEGVETNVRQLKGVNGQLTGETASDMSYKQIGRRSGSSAAGDRQAEKPKRKATMQARQSGKSNNSRNQSTILTSARGVLGSGPNNKTVLGS